MWWEFRQHLRKQKKQKNNIRKPTPFPSKPPPKKIIEAKEELAMVLLVELSKELITSINIYKTLSGERKYKKRKPI
jgi:hypothetical protein